MFQCLDCGETSGHAPDCPKREPLPGPVFRKKTAYERRRERDQMMRDLGLTKVRGRESGRTYWE